MVGEAGGRGGKASESTHLSFFCFHRIAVLFFGDTFTFSNGTSLCFSFTVSIGLTKDRERSKTVACARYLTLQ